MAASRVSLQIKGVEDIRRLLKANNRKVIRATSRVVFEVANTVKIKAQALVPFDEGILHGTANAQMVSTKATLRDPTAEVTFGGPAAPYALRQHEDRTYRHKPGRTAGYLSIPTNAALRDFDKLIVNRIKEELF